VRLVIIATGALQGPGFPQPEKTYRALDPAALMESFRLNTVGPALVAKHLLPLMAPRGKTVFAALSARVGSIGDNRAGGWHAYRASKAALNMILRNLAIETARRNPHAICVGLHPGTVDTGLSRPFQRGLAEGQLFTPETSARHLLTVIDALTPADSGRVLAWDGQTVPP
jgi:NAD(P)-dependent dehydrogenase (short-subunit alcohol dehydrogenase family)